MESKAKTVGRHYTPLEKKIFLEILKKKKDCIENKKSDVASLKMKEAAWLEIVDEYNSSSSITQQRTVAQLKKLWTNSKQSQRDALTKEKQARLATGGGPELPASAIDPDVALIAPHLMTNAPVLITSNMSDGELDTICAEILKNPEFNPVADDKLPPKSSDVTQINLETEPPYENILIETVEAGNSKDRPSTSKAAASGCTTNRKRARTTFSDNQTSVQTGDRNDQIESLKIERVRKLMEHDEMLANHRRKDEVNLANLRFRYEEESMEMKRQHLKLIQELELREAKAKAELAELQLRLMHKQ